MAPRSTLTLHALDPNGAPVLVKCYRRCSEALQQSYSVHRLSVPDVLSNLTAANVVATLRETTPPSAQVLRYNRGRLQLLLNVQPPEGEPAFSPQYPVPLRFLIRDKTLYLINSIVPSERCTFCGTYYQRRHTCNVRRADFYFHHVHSDSSQWWEVIAFSPVGAPPTRRLFLTYDIETYTWHGAFGKQLVPFLLVLTFTGDADLVKQAQTIAAANGWINDADTFYILSPVKNYIGACFLRLRTALQQHLCSLLWDFFLQRNCDALQTFAAQQNKQIDSLLYEDLVSIPLTGQPEFFELCIVGHNISGFDEIVLAAQTIDQETAVAAGFNITRNFMPRNGRLLFNDITYALPNPVYSSDIDYTLWEQGILCPEHLRQQYVRVMVRDTFALTHTSLRNAAAAYALSVSKTYCPYQAVNDFYMTGSYQKDNDGFPALQYWASTSEYNESKQLWLQKKENAYDIIHEALLYCQQDVRVTAHLVNKLIDSYQNFVRDAIHLPCSFNVFQRPTISANSHALFRQVLYRHISPQQSSFTTYLMAPSTVMYDFVRESIRGGRCYPTFLGVFHEPIYVYDICGMYASALTHPMPAGKPLNPLERALAISHYTRRLQTQTPVSYFDPCLLPAIFVIDADPPAEPLLDVLPPFCSRRGGRLCWTNESLRGEIATSIDVITLHNRGWTVHLVPDERTTVFPQWECLARDYVQLNIAAKEQADANKNQTLRSIAKLLSNALYGSFATKLDNKKIVFQSQMTEELNSRVASGEYFIRASSFLETENLCAELMPQFVAAYSPSNQILDSSVPGNTSLSTDDDDETDVRPLSYIDAQNPHVITYQPITFLDANDEDMCLLTLEKNSELIENNRYPSQIASFVLAWTRAFMSEWSQFLYADDQGVPINERNAKSVYGDTDSLFLTAEGHQLMMDKGKHRLKKNGGRLVFDPSAPDLTWLVECETVCQHCGSDAYSTESVFLAPKLYGLKELRCSSCAAISKGKLRAKGHATDALTYYTLKQCFLSRDTSNRVFCTSRQSIKKTLMSCQSHVQPFTVTETTLTRTLRPWQDLTLRRLDHQRLAPYSNAHPNPRNTATTWMEIL